MTKKLPQLPDQIVEELVQEQGLTIKDAKTLIELNDGERLDYFDLVCQELAALKDSSNLNLESRKKTTVTIANW